MATNVSDLGGHPSSDIKQRMDDVLARQKAAHEASLPVGAKIRKDRIARAIALLVDHQDRLIAAMDEDFGGRPELMSRFADIMSSVKALKFARKNLDTWMKRDSRSLDFPLKLLGARAWVEYQPKGVVGLISPWNFPVNLTFGPLAGIFAAGNRVMIKPSEHTPATSEVMKELFEGAYDETEVAVFTGGPEVGEAFSGLAFDHLLFTGATSIGRHVMRAAAENLVPVTLELGGKSPVIVSRSVEQDKVADRVVIGKMMNAGQICLAPDYLLVPRDQEDQIVDAIASKAAEMYPTVADNPDYAAVLNARHRSRLEGYIEDAKAKGAEVVVVNPAKEHVEETNTNRMPLHIVRAPRDEMKVMQEEIFGPILPVMGYDQIEDAIEYINAHPRPLGLYYFGEDDEERERVLARTTSGGVTVNDVIWHVGQEDLPFGGIGPSGMGVYHGEDGFKTFSHVKSVYKQAKIDLAGLVGARPPYGSRLKKTLDREIRK